MDMHIQRLNSLEPVGLSSLVYYHNPGIGWTVRSATLFLPVAGTFESRWSAEWRSPMAARNRTSE